MRDIVKADLYYFKKKIKYALLALVVCYVMNASQMVTPILLGEDYELSNLMARHMVNTGMIVLLTLLILDSCYVGQLFQTRLINPMVIRAGRNYAILTKYCLMILFNILFAGMVFFAILLTLSVTAGGNRVMNELRSTKHLGIIFLSVLIIVVRLTVQVVSITVLTGNTGLAVLANYMYFMVPSMPVLLLGTSELGLFRFTRLFVMGQLYDFMNAEDPGLMFGKIMVTSFVSITLWLIMSIVAFKHKDLR